MFSNIFGGKSAGAQATPAGGAGGSEGTQGTQGTQSAEPVEPSLNDYSDLFTVDPEASKQPAISPQAALFPQLTAENLMKESSKYNLVGNIDPAILEKASEGGQEGVAALLQAVNQTSQRALAASQVQSAQLITDALTKILPALNLQQQQNFKSLQSRTAVYEANPQLENPAVAPMVEMLRTQIEQKHPNLSPAQVSQKVNGYFELLARELTGAGKEDPKNTAAQEAQSWQDFFN